MIELGPVCRAQVLCYVVAVTGADRMKYAGHVARSVPAHGVIIRAQCFLHYLFARRRLGLFQKSAEVPVLFEVCCEIREVPLDAWV